MAKISKAQNNVDKFHKLLFLVVFMLIGTLFISTTFASPRNSSAVTGTFSIASPTGTISYGDTLTYSSTTSGKLHTNSNVYITTYCSQYNNELNEDEGVYHGSSNANSSIILVDSAVGLGLEWNGGDASCYAWLIYRVDKGKSSEINVLDTLQFDVKGTI